MGNSEEPTKKLSQNNSLIMKQDYVELYNQAYSPQEQSFYLRKCEMWAQVLFSRDQSTLKVLQLINNKVQVTGIHMILRCMNNNLRKLQLKNCQITGNGIMALVMYTPFNLTQLNLKGNMIGSLGIKWLTKSNLPNLRKIDISSCGIGDQGMKYLTKNTFPNLSYICLLKNMDNLTSSEKLKYNNWKYLQKLLYLSQPICCFNYLLIQSPNAKIPAQLIQPMKTNKLKYSVRKCFKRRCMIKSLNRDL